MGEAAVSMGCTFNYLPSASGSSLSGLKIYSQRGKEGVNAKVNDVFVCCKGGANTRTALFGEVGVL